MHYVPKSHQVAALRRLIDTLQCSLFALPGSGKTSIALSLIKITGARALVIAPLQTMLSSWPGEIAKWDQFNDIDYAIAHGKNKEEAFNHQVVLINPNGIAWLENNRKLLNPFDTLIVDESTVFKTWMSKRSRLLRRLLPYFERRLIMTGTPTPKGLIHWFSQQFIVDQGASFGKYITSYKERYFYQEGYKFKTWEPREGTRDKLVALAAPHVHVVSDEGLDIPDASVIDIDVILPKDALKQYKSMMRKLVAEVDDKKYLAANVGVAYGKCRQILSGAMYVDDGYELLHSQKLERCERLIEELNGAPVVVFYQFRFECDEMIKRLGSNGVATLNGNTSTRDRVRAVKNWNAGKLNVLLIQTQSGAHGLNLQDGGHHMIWLTVPDDPELYEQASRRMRRLGAKNKVIIYRIRVPNTIDDIVIDRLETRISQQEALVNYCKKVQAKS